MNRKNKRRIRKINKKKVGAIICIALTALTIKLYPHQIFIPGEWDWDIDGSSKNMVCKFDSPYKYDYVSVYCDEVDQVETIAKTNEVTIIDTKAEKVTNVSSNGINLIKKYEGCKLTAYKLKGEKNYTIGYGTSNRSIKPGQRITEKDAEKMLMDEVSKIERYLNKKDLELNQNEYDALVSFGFNCGIGNLNKLISGRDKEEIASHIMSYTGSKSKSNKNGLTKRRTEELNLFMGGN